MPEATGNIGMLGSTMVDPNSLGTNVTAHALCPTCGKPATLMNGEDGNQVYYCQYDGEQFTVDKFSYAGATPLNNPNGKGYPISQEQSIPQNTPTMGNSGQNY